ALGSVNDMGGANNTWVGVGALSAVTGGARNTAFGTNALNLNTNGSNNIGIGYGALNTNTTGQDNTAIGVYALRNFTDTSNNLDYNTAVGMDAGVCEVAQCIHSNSRVILSRCVGVKRSIANAYVIASVRIKVKRISPKSCVTGSAGNR